MSERDDDPHDLARFVAAQSPSWPQARAELAAGRKTSHWMWFVFPQLRGLGLSAMAQRFGIASLDEARAYLRHPVLGARLVEAARLVVAAPAGRSAREVMGAPDDAKLRSSMTLFDVAARGAEPAFGAVLDRFFGGGRDPRTIELLDAGGR